MELGRIYIVANKINGKRYVGQTEFSFEHRLKDHRKERKNLHFGSALRKYGIDNFEVQQIIYDQKDLNYWEQYFIDKLNTFHPNGYNHTTGGNVFKASEATKKKQSLAHKGHPGPVFTVEVRKKISERMMGNKNYLLKHSEETKKKMSEIQKKRIHTPEQIARLAIVAEKGRETIKKKVWSQEYRDALSARAKAGGYGKWSKGTHRSEESKALMSQKSKEAWIKRKSNGYVPPEVSDKTKAAISAKKKEWWAERTLEEKIERERKRLATRAINEAARKVA